MTELSIVTSMYNDEDCVKSFIETVVDAAKGFGGNYEIIIVNNASLDNTGKMCDKYAKRHSNIKVVHVPKPNLGKGNGVRLGIEKTSGKYIALLDPDLQQNPKDIFKLLKILKENDYGAIIGWRMDRSKDPFYRLFYSKIYNAVVVKLLFNLPVPDASGQPRIFKREAIAGYKIVNKRWGIEVELPYIVKRRGYKIGFTPVDWRQRIGNQSKVKFFTAFDIFLELIKFRFGWSN